MMYDFLSFCKYMNKRDRRDGMERNKNSKWGWAFVVRQRER